MDILRATATFYPHVTGPAYQAYRIAKGMAHQGHTSTLITSNYKPDEDCGYPPDMTPEDDFPFIVKRYRILTTIDQYRIAPLAATEVFQDEYDLIHAHGYHNALKDLLYLANTITNLPFVLHAHGSFGWHMSSAPEHTIQYKLYDKLLSRTASNADAVVVSTHQEREEAEQVGVASNKIHVISVGKDPEPFLGIPRAPPGDHLSLLFVGRLAPRRNVEAVLEAMALLDTSTVELRIVGDESALSGQSRSGYVDELRTLSQQLGIEDDVVFTGAKYGEALIREYRSAHVFVNPTEYENFGQTTLEAAYAGLAIVATPTGVATELVDDGETGYIIQDVADLVDSLQRFINNPNLSHELGERAQAKAITNYRWEDIISEYEALYQALV